MILDRVTLVSFQTPIFAGFIWSYKPSLFFTYPKLPHSLISVHSALIRRKLPQLILDDPSPLNKFIYHSRAHLWRKWRFFSFSSCHKNYLYSLDNTISSITTMTEKASQNFYYISMLPQLDISSVSSPSQALYTSRRCWWKPGLDIQVRHHTFRWLLSVSRLTVTHLMPL